MTITVDQLVNNQRLDGINVITKPENLKRVISTVTVLDAPDGPSWLKGEELVLTSGYIFKDEHELVTFIHYLIDVKACGLGIKLNRYHSHISQEIIELANQHAFSIIVIPYHFVWSDVMSIYYSLNEKEVIEASQISSKDIYSLYVASKWGTVPFVKRLVELVPCALIVFDHCNQLVYETKHETCQGSEIAFAPSLVTYFKTNYIEQIDSHYYLFKKGFESNKQLFYIVKSDNQRLLENVLEVVAMLTRFQKNDRFENTTDQMYGFLLNKLASETLTSEEIAQFAIDQGINETIYTAVALIGHQESQAVLNQLQIEIRQLLPKDALKFHSYLQFNDNHESLLVLIELHRDDFFSIIELHYALQLVSHRVREKASDYLVISEFYPGLSRIQGCFVQAVQTVNIGRLIYTEQPFIAYDKVALFDFSRKQKVPLINFLEIERLQVDTKKSSYDLVRTLEVYLEEKNFKKAAERLFLHENTLRYRIQKISDLLRMDFDDNFYATTLLAKIKWWKLI